MRAARALCAAALIVLAGPALAKKRPLGPGEKVDLNRATAAELMRLPGIGRARAEAIVAHRARAPFKAPAEVAQVKGISRSWLEKNQARLSAGPAAPTVKPARGP